MPPIPGSVVDAPTGRATVLAVGASRQLQALCAAGHDQRTVGDWLGGAHDTVRLLLAGHRHTTIPARIAGQVEEVYLTWCATPAAMSAKHQTWITGKGWVTAAGWIDLPIGDPTARPWMNSATSIPVHRVLCQPVMPRDVAGRVQQRLDGTLRAREMTVLELAYVVRRLLLAGETRGQAQLVTGLAPKVINAMWRYLCV